MVNERLFTIESGYMNNDNIDRAHIGKKGLHLNDRGVGRLVLNIVKWLNDL